MLQSIGVAVSGVALAGCGEDMSRGEKIDRWFKSAPWLATGESIAIEFSDDQWRIGIESIAADGTAVLDVTKYAMDEAGANKEGGAGAIDITRSIKFGKTVELEPDCIVTYICRNDTEVRLGIDDYMSNTGSMSEVVCDE